MIIDVHGHFIPQLKYEDFKMLFSHIDSYSSNIKRMNGSLFTEYDNGLLSIEKQISDMDKTGIDFRILSIAPFLFYYELESYRTILWSKAVNDQMYKDIHSYSSRILGLATLPMNSIEDACNELERTMNEYNFIGAQIATNINGIELDDESLNPFWETAEKTGAFILLHPHYTIGGERLGNFHLRNIIGNPTDTTIAAMRIIIGGIFERYPNLKICLSHCGGYLPYAASRFDRAYKVRPELSHLTCLPSNLLNKFFYDSIIFDTKSLEYVIEKVGIERILVGTDYPFDMGELNPTEFIEKLYFDKSEKEKILFKNAQFLLDKHGR